MVNLKYFTVWIFSVQQLKRTSFLPDTIFAVLVSFFQHIQDSQWLRYILKIMLKPEMFFFFKP